MVAFSVIKQCFKLQTLLYDEKLRTINTVLNDELLSIWTVIKYGKHILVTGLKKQK